MALIQADQVHVELPVLSADNRSLRRTLLNVYNTGRVTMDSHNRIVIKALRGLSFQFRDGDRVGLVGRNGAGKSTLLRALAGVYVPSSGSLKTEGRVVPLLNLGVGIRDDSTGYENIRICSLLLGMSDKEISERTKDIADFTELGEYLSMPLHTYSAGMRMRLAFAVATATTPDILLIDENVSAGDAGFLKKAEARMKQLIAQSRIVVLATHSNEMIMRDCSQAIWLEQGSIAASGETAMVLKKYQESFS